MRQKRQEPKYHGRHDLDELRYLRHDAKPFTVISLFSGAGGFDIGTAGAGFQTRVMVEWEKAACDTLRVNFTKAGHNDWCDRQIAATKDKKLIATLKRWRKAGPRPATKKGGWYHKPEPAIMCEDITKLSSARILEAAKLRLGECTLLTGGFPCQGFSTARGNGRNTNDFTYDKRNFLYRECVRVIRETLPKTFVLENVPGLIQMEKGRVVRMICDDLAKSGYNVTWYKLNAADYGVPQNRIRVFFFGRRNDVMRFDAKGKKVPALHIGGAVGTITHPDWFIEKYGDEHEKQSLEAKAKGVQA